MLGGREASFFCARCGGFASCMNRSKLLKQTWRGTVPVGSRSRLNALKKGRMLPGSAYRGRPWPDEALGSAESVIPLPLMPSDGQWRIGLRP